MPQKFFYEPDDNATALFRFLDTNGDGTGTKNANGNYSVTADDFFIQPAAGEVFVLNRLIVELRDSQGIQAEEYGNLGSALSNGINIKVTDSSDVEILDLTDGLPVTTNAAWGRMSYDVDVKSWGAGDEVLLCRWTFGASGRPLILKDQQKFKVTLNDNLTGLVAHYFMVQGYKGVGATGNRS